MTLASIGRPLVEQKDQTGIVRIFIPEQILHIFNALSFRLISISATVFGRYIRRTLVLVFGVFITSEVLVLASAGGNLKITSLPSSACNAPRDTLCNSFY
jgi:hypothetical protein